MRLRYHSLWLQPFLMIPVTGGIGGRYNRVEGMTQIFSGSENCPASLLHFHVQVAGSRMGLGWGHRENPRTLNTLFPGVPRGTPSCPTHCSTIHPLPWIMYLVERLCFLRGRVSVCVGGGGGREGKLPTSHCEVSMCSLFSLKHTCTQGLSGFSKIFNS